MEPTKKSMKWLWGIVVIIAIIILALASSKPKETGPIKIGFIAPLTGDAASLGQNSRAAVEISVKEINDAGGINGRPLEIIYEDGQCSGKPASDAANKLINIDKVPVIIGGLCSGETSSFTDAAEKSKTVVLSYCSSAPALTFAGDYIFRNYPSDSYQGSFAADYIYNKLGKRNVAVLYVNTDYGVGIKDVFDKKFKELGGNLLDEESFKQNSSDLRTELTKIKSVKPELVYFIGYTEETIPGIKQAKDLGINVPYFGADAWGDSKIWSTLGSLAEGDMYTMVYTPLNDAFKSNMLAKIGNNEITVCTPQAYDAVKIIAQIITKVGTNSEAIKNELYKTEYKGGVSAPDIKFDSNGDVNIPYVLKTVKDGKFVLLQNI